MKKENREALIQEFNLKIKEYEDVLFGMELFIQGISFFWKHNREAINLNQQHYKNARERMEKAINKAKEVLREVGQCPDKLYLLQEFQFPPIKGNPFLDEGTNRFKALTQAYNDLFSEREKDEPLTKEEYKQLSNLAMDKINP